MASYSVSEWVTAFARLGSLSRSLRSRLSNSSPRGGHQAPLLPPGGDDRQTAVHPIITAARSVLCAFLVPFLRTRNEGPRFGLLAGCCTYNRISIRISLPSSHAPAGRGLPSHKPASASFLLVSRFIHFSHHVHSPRCPDCSQEVFSPVLPFTGPPGPYPVASINYPQFWKHPTYPAPRR